MALQFATRDANEIKTVRQSFVESENRQTYDELAQAFNVPVGTIKRYAADECWISMRLAHQEQLARQSDALGIVLRATKIDQTLIEKFGNAIVALLEKLTRTAQDIDDTRAPSTRAQAINTMSFALNNLASASKTIGIIGLPKGLGAEGKEDNGRWNPQLLNQINVTVQQLTKDAGKTQATETPAESIPEAKSTT